MVTQHIRPRSLTETEKRTRKVWAAISQEPNASRRKLAKLTGIPMSAVNTALHRLRSAGYIDFVDGRNGTNRILVPFIAITKTARMSKSPKRAG